MSARALSLTSLILLAACRGPAPIHKSADEHNTWCTRYLEEGDLDKAQHRCELALEYNQDFPLPWNNLCLVAIKRAQLDKAKELCIKAIRLNNDFAEAHNNLGYIYMQQKSFGKAHDAFRNALRINPGYLEARYNLALSLLRLKRFEEARVQYDKIIEINPNLADPYHDLCALDIEQGNSGDAVRYCLKAVELDPKYTLAWMDLGNAYMKSGKHCEAQDAFKSCVAVDENSAECRNNLAIAARYCALASPHLKDAREAASDANSPIALYRLGLEEKEKGLLSEAERRFKKCVKADGRFGLCYCQLADLSRGVARDAEMRTFCKKCINYTTQEQNIPERDLCEKILRPE